MMISYTKTQQQAIDAPTSNLLVSAAAGSGKTAVLSARVLRLLTQHDAISPEQLLIVTYTVAAAGQMRRRIEESVTQQLANDPENTLLQTQQLLLPSAKICTIHALCSDIIKQHATLLDLTGDFQVGDTAQLEQLKSTTLDELMEQHYRQKDESFLRVIDHFCVKDDREIPSLVTQIYGFIRNYPFPLSYLSRFLEMFSYQESFLQTTWGIMIAQESATIFSYFIEQYQMLLPLLLEDEKLKKAYLPAFQSDHEWLLRLQSHLTAQQWDALIDTLHTYSKPKLSGARNVEDEELQQKCKTVREDLHKHMSTLNERMLSFTEQQAKEDAIYLHTHLSALCGLVKEYDEALWEEKKRRGLLEFSDLEHLCLQLLVQQDGDSFVKTPLALVLSEQYHEIMIDECQDMNKMQNLIFWALAKSNQLVASSTNELLLQGENLFLVGDVKQSIYRFRNAMPELFVKRTALFDDYSPTLAPAQEPCQGSRIVLQQNFRSRHEVTDSVNQIFKALMQPSFGDVDYNAKEALVPAATYPPCEVAKTELHLLDKKTDQPPADETSAPYDDNPEATYVANLIATMVEQKYPVTHQGVLRPCMYGDFCVLLRSAKGKMEQYRKAFKKIKIPCQVAGENDLFAQSEVVLVRDLLQVLDNPLVDVSLLSLLLSPLFLFSADQLVELRVNYPAKNLHASLHLSAQAGDASCASVLSMLAMLREQALLLSMPDFMGYLYDSTELMQLMLAMEMGEQKQLNLRLLQRFATQYEASGKRGLFGFVRHLEILATNAQTKTSTPMEQAADSVRIMTIHGSKGLEFPICIVSDLGKGFYTQDLHKSLLLHEQYGFGMELRNRHTLQKYMTGMKAAVQIALKREMLSEELRVLYVAMTRGKEKLILTASTNNLEKTIDNVLKLSQKATPVTPFTLGQLHNFAEWILAALATNPSFSSGLQGGTNDFSVDKIGVVRARLDQFQGATTIATPVPAHKIPRTATADSAILAQLQKATAFVYPYTLHTTLPTKYSVTQLAKNAQTEGDVAITPWEFSKETTPISGAQRGTILHHFLQRADLALLADSVENEIQRIVHLGILSKAQADTLHRKKIEAFAKSPLCGRMQQASERYTEYPFLFEFPASEIVSEHSHAFAEEMVLVQGIVDVVLIEENGVVIVDYKSDRLENPEEFLLRYQKQLALYRRAIEHYFERPVVACLLYSLHLEQEIAVE